MSSAVPVDPAALADVPAPEQLVAAMRRRVAVSGLMYQELESRADAVGDQLSVEAMLHDDAGLPSERAVAALIRACDGGAGEVADWVAVHRRLSAQAGQPDVATAPTGVTPPRWLPSWLVDVLPPIFLYPRRPVRGAAVALAGVLLAGVVTLWVTDLPYEEFGRDAAVAPEEAVPDEAEEEQPAPAPRSSALAKPGATQPPAPTEERPETPNGGVTPTPPPAGEPETRGEPEPGGTYTCEPYPSQFCHYEPGGGGPSGSPSTDPYCPDPYAGCTRPAAAWQPVKAVGGL